MAVGWGVTLFKTILSPKVVAYAPELLSSALKLWRSYTQKTQLPNPHHSEAITDLGQRVTVLENSEAQFNEQAREALSLISSLAEQNAQLVKAVDLLGWRTRVLAILSTILGVAVIAIIIVLFMQRT